MERYDLIVIGAGITGLASAYHIKRENRDLRVGILDRAPTYAQGNTAKSDAAFRDTFTSELNFKLSSTSIGFYRYIQEELGYNLGMHFNGYMFLLDETALNSESVKHIQQRADTKILTGDEVASLGINVSQNGEVKKIMNLKDISGGLIGKNCGILEPDLVASYYASELQKMGAEFHYSTNLEKIRLEPVDRLDYPGEPFIWQNKMIGGLNTNRGDFVAYDYILATDVWATSLLDPIGIDSHIRPKKRQVFQVSSNEIKRMVTTSYDGKEGLFPFTILPGPMIDMRPDPRSQTFWVSYTDDIGRDFSLEDDPQPEMDFYEKNLYPVLREYVPAFIDSKVTSSWAGYYSINTLDGTYYIFKELNLIVATGSSGSGIMKGDAAGRIVAALYSGKEKAVLYGGSTLDVSDLGIKNRKAPMENLII